MAQIYKILILDQIGLKGDGRGEPDISAVRQHIAAQGGVLHERAYQPGEALAGGLVHFFYQPGLNGEAAIVEETRAGQYDGVIAAAKIVPARAQFALGGVRIGAGTGNMQSASWGGGSGIGGTAVLMNTPGFNAEATAQMVMKALLRVSPDLPLAAINEQVMAGQFDTTRQLKDYPTEKLAGKRLGVLGFGHIGREVARLGAAFGLAVQVYAREQERIWIEALGYRFAPSPEAAAAGADFLSVHLGLGAYDEGSKRTANQGLVGEAVLSALSPGAVLINFDRGELVEVAALAQALASGQISHAAVDADLFVDEATGAVSGPLAPYLALVPRWSDQLLLLPHVAADTDHPSRVAGAIQAVDQIFALIHEKTAINVKGSLPDGIADGGRHLVPGISRMTAHGLAACEPQVLQALATEAARLAEGWQALAQARGEERLALARAEGLALLLANARYHRLSRQLGLAAGFNSEG